MNALDALETCRQIHHEYGTSYYWATKLFPRDMREGTYALYAFFRVPDEMVDTVGGATHLREAYGVARMTEGLAPIDSLKAWRQAWQSGSLLESDAVIYASRQTFNQFVIPEKYADAFLSAMEQDLTQARYRTYKELEVYMYGSAAAVGLMMTHIIGFSDARALPYAEKLGYAMQLTNFLRDIGEDFVERGRIYLPLDEWEQFGLTEEDVQKQVVDDRFKDFMRFQIARADALFEEANQGIHFLHRRGQLGVRAGSDLYRMILRKIEAQGYDVYRTRARTSGFEKAREVIMKSIPALL